MDSVLVSKIAKGYELSHDFLQTKLNEKSKIVILPWAFPTKLDKKRFSEEYFKEGEPKYNKYVNPLLELKVKKENIYISNPYDEEKNYLKAKIKEADCLILPGGNPEMFFNLVVHKFDLLYDIKYFKGLIIGESAGAVLHLERYFITAKNNYYQYFAFYDGFGILKDPFYIDVHTSNNKQYLEKLKKIAEEKEKDIYAIYDDGAMILNRKTLAYQLLGNVKKISYEKGEK